MDDYEMKRVGLPNFEYTDIPNGRSLSIYVEPGQNGSKFYVSEGLIWSNGDAVTWSDVEKISSNIEDYLDKNNIKGSIVLR